ncbi:MAG: cadherin-like domain-containing protein, partial [Holophagales bacterium]|nr:cadherin-like domain-containing protein [Holophagales bacterium]
MALGGEVRVHVDADADPGTGCTVTTIEGAFDGVEQTVVTTIDDGTDQVTAVDRFECVDPGTDTFGPAIPVVDIPTPWNVGLGVGTNGSDVVETYLPVAALGTQPTAVRLAFEADDQGGAEDALLTLDGMQPGDPILLPLGTILDIPTLSQVALAFLSLLLALSAVTVLRGQRGPFVVWLLACLAAGLVATGVLAVASIVLDGDPSDWGADVSASDPEMDAPVTADIVAGFASASPDFSTLFFRVDVNRGNLPNAVDDTATVTEDDPATDIDVLANDSDPDGFGLTVVSVTQPANGAAAVADIGGGPGSGVSYTPDPDFCNDPPGTVTDDFTYTIAGGSIGTVAVTVTCVDDPPTITAIADQVIAEDGTTGPLAFTIADIDTPIGSLSLTPAPTSSNMVLIPDANLTLGGAGANRTIEAVPAADENDTSAGGPSTITVTVTDGTTPVTEIFQVSVTLVDDPPTITPIADQVIQEDGTTGPLAFTIADVDTPIGSLSLTPAPSASNMTLIPDRNLTLGGAGANRTIEAVPAADENDASAGGAATITVTVTDGTTPVTEVFQVSVSSVNDPPACTAVSGPASFTEDGGPVVIDSALTVSDVDNANLASATMTLTNLLDVGLESLAAATGGTSIVANYAAPVLTLTGPDTVANFQQVLRSVTYENTDQDPDTTTRIVNCVVSDGTDPSP